MDVEYPPNVQPVQNTKNTSDLVKRLKALSEALQDSDTNDECKTPDRYRSLAAHLASNTFLDNSSRDVQVWLACCLADIFRLFAPQIPFGDPDKLREVLIFLTRSLKGLDSPSGPLFRRYFYLLENISACNTLHLTLELPGEEACVVIKHLIKTTMDIVNGKEWVKERELSEDLDETESVDSEKEDRNDRREKMHHLLLSACIKLLSEVDQITIPVLDALFFYLINPQKSNYRESYIMARNIIQGANSSLDVPVENLLTRSLLIGSFLEECELVGSSRQKLYDVIIELHEVIPSLVVPVIPQIGNFLKDSDAESRVAAMKAVGVMVSNPKSRLVEDYPDVWLAYLERRRDAIPKIRSLFAKQALNILLNNSQLRGPICDELVRLLKDPDEEVRLQAFNSAFEAARRKLDSVNEDLILACCEKMFDVKANIRLEAIGKLLQLHSKVISGEEYTVSDRQVVSIIAACTFRLYRSADIGKEEKVKVERLFNASIVPFRMETEKRIRRMLELYERLSKNDADGMMNIILRNAAYRKLTREILFVIKEDMGKEKKGKEIENRIERIGREQPDPIGFSHLLRKLTNLLTEDPKAFEYLYHTVESDYTCAKVVEAVSNFLMSVAESKKFTKEETNTVRYFVERLAPLIMDKEGAELLVQLVMRADGDFTCKKADSEGKLYRALMMMKTWGEVYPHVFTPKHVVDRLIKLLDSNNVKTVEIALNVFLFIGSQQKARELAAEWIDDVVKIAWELVVTEQPGFGRVAKLAVRVLCKLEAKEVLVGLDGKLMEVAEKLEERLDVDNPACVNALRALSAMQRATPDDFLEKFSAMMSTTIVPLILAGESDPDDPRTLDLAAEDINKLPMPKYTMVKIHAMKLLARSLYGHADLDALARKSVKLFATFIEGNGNIHGDETTISPVEYAHLRAVAGSCILRVSYIPKYLKMMTTEQFLVVSRLVTDSADCVRRYFVDRLFKGINRNKLTVEFISLFALPSLLRNSSDGDEIHKYLEDCRTRLKMCIMRRAQMIRCVSLHPGNVPFFQPEYSIAYAIWLLATQPILTSYEDVDNLAFLQENIWFLMDAYVLNKSHFDFELMYRSLQEVRQSKSVWAAERVKDGEMTTKAADEINKKMWALADLALCMMVYRAKIVIVNVPGETKLVDKFFRRMKEVNDPVYAPMELIEAEKKRNGKVPTERKRGMNGTTTAGATKTKAGRTKGTRVPAQRKKKEKIVESESEEDEIEESDSEEEVMPAPSKRQAAAASSSSNGPSPTTDTRRRSDPKNTSSSPKKTPKRGSSIFDSPKTLLKKRSHAAMVASTSRGSLPEPEDKKKKLSLENLPFSPIAKDSKQLRGTGVASGLVSSTPLVKGAGGTRTKRITLDLDELDENDEEDEVEEKTAPTSKRGRSSRSLATDSAKSSPKKNVKEVTKSPEKKPAAASARATRSSALAKPNGFKKESDDEEDNEEEEMEEKPVKKGRSAAAVKKIEEKPKRGGRKAPARKAAGQDKEEDEENDEVKEESPAPRRSSTRKAPARKSAAKEAKKDEEDNEVKEEDEPVAKKGRSSSRKAPTKKTTSKDAKKEEVNDEDEDEEPLASKKTIAKKPPKKKEAPPPTRVSRRNQAKKEPTPEKTTVAKGRKRK